METIELARIFVKIVQHGSFTKAAEILNIRKSTVSKAISRLEAETGTKLLIRSTRNHTLTQQGQIFYENCLGPIHALEEAQKKLFGADDIAIGNVKLTAPEDIGTHLIAPIIGKISNKNPKLKFNLQYTNKVVDLIKDGFDLAVRLGPLRESRLKTKKIGKLKLILVASPNYLKSSKSILEPTDLKEHKCLTISDNILSRNWVLRKGKAHKKISISPIIESNQMSSLLEVCLNDGGVLLAPSFICQKAIKDGKLIHVLDEWHNQGPQVSLVSPLSMNSTARLKTVSTEIETYLKDSLNHLSKPY
jgi:DNA-binding transcriptional LysR family regulator